MSQEARNLTDEQKIILEHYANEWKMVNQYINEIDLGYDKFLTTVAMICGGFMTLLAFIFDKQVDVLRIVFGIVPIGFLVVFGVLSYQFRITAILRGHMACIEDEMNKILGRNIYLWNSALVEAYMAHKNWANSFLMVPVCFLLIVSAACCIFFSVLLWPLLINILYWSLFCVIALIILFTFSQNERIRHETYNTEEVVSQYHTFWNNFKKNKKEEKQDRKKAKNVKPSTIKEDTEQKDASTPIHS